MKKLKVMTIAGTRPELIRLSEIIKKAKEVFEDARDFQYVRLGFEDSNYGSKEQVCYNWEIIKEFKEVCRNNETEFMNVNEARNLLNII